MEKIGLIAGNRKFPLLFSQAAKKNNLYVVAVAIKGDTSKELKKYADEIHWIGLDQFSRMFDIFKERGVSNIVMAGQISPKRLFSKEIKKDDELQKILTSVKDKRADTLFAAVADKLKEAGFSLLDSSVFLKDFMPAKGRLTEPDLSPLQWEDVSFGLSLAKAVAELDIGQTVAVKEKAVVAIEALEGTDNLIRRAGKIAGDNIVVVKVSKPRQDMRFDIPVVGLNTIKNLARVKAACLAIEAEKTLFIDQRESVKLAQKKGIAIVAI
ncbi:MAG: UDP-2,3-diacylglucosamine diphosphatase LpxI [Candidatus Omnitrophota bacterium]